MGKAVSQGHPRGGGSGAAGRHTNTRRQASRKKATGWICPGAAMEVVGEAFLQLETAGTVWLE